MNPQGVRIQLLQPEHSEQVMKKVRKIQKNHLENRLAMGMALASSKVDVTGSNNQIKEGW